MIYSVEPVFATLAIATLLVWFHSRKSVQRPFYQTLVVVALFLFSWTPVTMLSVRVLQSPYSRSIPVDEEADAIVVLAQSVYDPFPPLPFPLAGENTYEACRYAAWLHKNWRPLPLLVTGGKAPGDETEPYSRAMVEVLLKEGVPQTQIWVEDRSGSTYENALYSAEILKTKGVRRIALITDALHMRRSEKCFKHQGLLVTPVPCRFLHVYGFHKTDFLPSIRSIQWNEQIVYETSAMLWYWLRGRI